MQPRSPHPKKHHYVPQFLLRQWADASGKLKCWSWRDNEITFSLLSPREALFSNHLYRASDIEDQGVFEKALSNLESRAASVLKKLCDSSSPDLEVEDFSVWASFLLSQRSRIPHRLDWLKQKTQEAITDELSKPNPEFEKLNKDGRFQNLEDFAREYAPDTISNAHLREMIRSSANPKFVSAILRMKWFVRHRCDYPILIGDDPVIVQGTFGTDEYVMALPLSPNHVFFATSTSSQGRTILRTKSKLFSSRVNEEQLKRATRCVIGDASSRFLENRLRIRRLI
jgi:hypothetical protein